MSPPSLITLILLCGLSVASLNMFLPSLANISAEFGTDYALINLSIAGYAATTAVLQLVLGPLSDRYGRRPVLLGSLVLFTLGSLGCLFATSAWSFLAFRLLQAAIVSGYAVSLAIVRDISTAQRAASRLGYMAMAWGVAPMLAPMAGGLLDQYFGWRASFLAFSAIGLCLFAISWFDLGETNNQPSTTFGAQFRNYPELFRSRRYWGYALCMAFSIGAFYVFLTGSPLVAREVFDISTARLGFFMGTITAGFLFGSFLSSQLAHRFALTTTMIAGRLVACTGLLTGLGFLAAGLLHPALYFSTCACVGIGNGLSSPSSNSGAMSVRPDLAGTAAGLSGALTVACGALLSALTGLIISADNAAWVLQGMMLLASLLGLAAALYVRGAERRIAAVSELAR